MHFKSILRMLSIILLIVSIFSLACGLFSIVEGLSWRVSFSLFIPTIISLAFFMLMYAITRHDERPFLTNKDSFLFVTFSWVFSSALGAIPFTFSGYIPSYIDAFYETVSGFTTTGASILTDIEAIPQPLLLWRATTHWLGGMGIVVLLVAILPNLGFSAIRIMEAETPSPEVDRIAPRISKTAKTLWLIYCGFTICEIILLVLGGMPLFDAICHSFATMATGGFGTKKANIAYYKSGFIQWVITIFMFLAGMNFTLHYHFLKGRIGTVLRDTEFKVYFAIVVISSLVIAVDLFVSGFISIGSIRKYRRFAAPCIISGFLDSYDHRIFFHEFWAMASALSDRPFLIDVYRRVFRLDRRWSQSRSPRGAFQNGRQRDALCRKSARRLHYFYGKQGIAKECHL